MQVWPASTWGHPAPTHAEGPGRGGSQAHRRKRQTHGGRARKTEVNRNKTEVESHLEVTEPESRRDGSQCRRGNEITHPEKPPYRKRGIPRWPRTKRLREETEHNRTEEGQEVDSAQDRRRSRAERLPKARSRKRWTSSLGQVHRCVYMGDGASIKNIPAS